MDVSVVDLFKHLIDSLSVISIIVL